MRSLLAVFLLSFTAIAAAHPVEASDSVIAQISHHVLSLHHLPVMLLVIFVALVAFGTVYRRDRD